MLKFVVQEHHASTHHFDFRLERDEKFKSRAVPKGFPDQPGTKRLAVQVADQGITFGDFEGVIPEGEYGAGKIEIRDRGFYEAETWSDEKIVATLHGTRVEGKFNLICFTHGRPTDWLLFKLPSIGSEQHK
jgi:DNA ligase D-like protein (predicted 3'-phosphoesterase)